MKAAIVLRILGSQQNDREYLHEAPQIHKYGTGRMFHNAFCSAANK